MRVLQRTWYRVVVVVAFISKRQQYPLFDHICKRIIYNRGFDENILVPAALLHEWMPVLRKANVIVSSPTLASK